MKPFAIFASALIAFSLTAGAQTSAPAVAIAPQRANVAAKKASTRPDIVKRFEDLHEKYLARAKEGNIDLLFLGDSITEGWAGRGKEVWAERYAKLNAANFGISGDRTQHVLWRIENGELENIRPRVCVLMIGTNNIGPRADTSDPVEQIADGVKKIVDTVREKTGAKVLLLAIFPRGADPKDPRTIAVRAKVAEINALIAKLDDGQNVRYFDLTNKFLEPDGTLSKDVMPDALHPNTKGYQIWADGMQSLLDEMNK